MKYLKRIDQIYSAMGCCVFLLRVAASDQTTVGLKQQLRRYGRKRNKPGSILKRRIGGVVERSSGIRCSMVSPERAVKNNLDLRIAEARVREERASLAATSAGLWPTLDVSGSYSRNRASQNAVGSPTQGAVAVPFGGRQLEQNFYQTGFDSSWEIDVFGGTRRQIEAAEAILQASIEERRGVLVTLLGDVARNYIDLRGLQRRLAVAQENLRAQQDTLGLTKVRFDAGLASDFEVAQSEGQVNTTAAQIPALQSALKQAAYRVDVLLGTQPGTSWDELAKVAPIPALPPQAHVGLPADLLRRRPDIRSAERQLAAATAQVGVATADLYPRFSLLGNIGLQSISASDWFSAQSRFWSIGPTISWPVFDAGRIRATIEIRNAQQEQALRQYEKSVLTAFEDVEKRFGQLRQRTNPLSVLARGRGGQSPRAANGQRSLYPGVGAVSQCFGRAAYALRNRERSGSERSEYGIESRRAL
jgi:NodT family efflux transporter outer membrane factor (OMF) lipoprotein